MININSTHNIKYGINFNNACLKQTETSEIQYKTPITIRTLKTSLSFSMNTRANPRYHRLYYQNII